MNQTRILQSSNRISFNLRRLILLIKICQVSLQVLITQIRRPSRTKTKRRMSFTRSPTLTWTTYQSLLMKSSRQCKSVPIRFKRKKLFSDSKSMPKTSNFLPSSNNYQTCLTPTSSKIPNSMPTTMTPIKAADELIMKQIMNDSEKT